MAITYYEAGGSREGTDATDRSSRAELRWHVQGSDDPVAIKSHLISVAAVPATYDGLIYRSITWEYQGPGLWEFTATYVHPDRSDKESTIATGSYTFAFDTTGTSATRTWSRGTTRYAPTGVAAADYKGAINFDGETVNGVDITIPGLKLSITKRKAKADITLAYVNTLYGLTGTVNNAAFLGFAAGELLFLGASGQQGTDSDPEITYHFLGSPNVTGLSIGDITGIDKKGHQYLWAFYDFAEDATAKQVIKAPRYIMVEDVYLEAAFSALGI